MCVPVVSTTQDDFFPSCTLCRRTFNLPGADIQNVVRLFCGFCLWVCLFFVVFYCYYYYYYYVRMVEMCVTDVTTTQDDFFLPALPIGGLSIFQDRLYRMKLVHNRTVSFNL